MVVSRPPAAPHPVSSLHPHTHPLLGWGWGWGLVLPQASQALVTAQ